MLFVLTVFGVALGVASVLSIQIINQNALAAFEGSMQAVSGDADLSVLGRMPTIPESLYVDVIGDVGVEAAWPLNRVSVALANRERFYLEVIGFDFFAPVRVPWDGGSPGDLSEVLARPGWAAFTPTLAEQMGWSVGDSVQVYSGSRAVWLQVGALVDFQKLSPLASPKMVVMDIAQAQHLLGRSGQIHQIDVMVKDGVDVKGVRDRLQETLGMSVQVVTPEQRSRQTEGLISAFRLNLTALSLISLVVGLFLVYSSTQASLVRRRAEFGMLRSIGTTRGQVFGLIVGEVVVIGSLGVVIGLLLGYWGAKANVDVVSSTLTNLYLLEEISTLQLSPWLFAVAGLIGVGGAVLGALLPAIDMSRRDTRSLLSAFTLHEKMGSFAPHLSLIGLGVFVVVSVWYVLGGFQWQHAGFVLAVGLLMGLPLFTPMAIRVLTAGIQIRNFGLGYSLKSVGARLQTTSFAVAALAIAVSMLVGITLMIGSFRETLNVWIHTTVVADVYVTPSSWRGQGDEAFLEDDLIQVMRNFKGVRAMDQLRGFLVYSNDQRLALAGVDIGIPGGASRFTLLDGDPETAFEQVHEKGWVLVGETLARKQNLWVGDSVPIYVMDGVHDFQIAGVYYDYNAQGGAVVLDLKTVEKYWGPGSINSVALYLEPGVDTGVMVDALKAEFETSAMDIRSNKRLRDEAMMIFDQTFAVTRLLQGISLLIAVCGIALMLLVLAREQVSELALYRAIGATRQQVFGLFVGKGLGMGLLGLVMGIAGGIALAMVLIFVINRAYFGWTIQVYWPWGALVQQMVTILGVSVLASLYPALKASRTPATELGRDDV
ncbi:MAG: putative ABC transport system permease protein [Candidatus Latescibacterota bacterium]|jgi:putative ABC transport system permease protein